LKFKKPKVLFLSPCIPYPINNGGRMRTWAFLDALTAEYDVSLLCLMERHDAEATLESLRGRFQNVWAVKPTFKRQHSLFDRCKNLLKGIPWEVGVAYSNEFEARIQEIVRMEHYDFIFARYMATAKYLFVFNDLLSRAIIDLDDLEFIKSSREINVGRLEGTYDKYRRMFNNWLYKRYHKRLSKVPEVIVCSEHDQKLLKDELNLQHVSIIANAIMVDKYASAAVFDTASFEKKTILFCGNLDYEPNAEGLKWFLHDIWPSILRGQPSVRLQIVGSCNEDQFSKFADNKSIFVHYNVPDVLPYYRDCSLTVVPLQVGGGTRIKILEACACGRPVVSTSIGAEGLDLREGQDCLIADSAESFAQACLSVISDFNTAVSLSRNGFNRVKDHYDTRIVRNSILRLIQKHNPSR
jgi:polysaccharide biosynthesis protein PslH